MSSSRAAATKAANMKGDKQEERQSSGRAAAEQRESRAKIEGPTIDK